MFIINHTIEQRDGTITSAEVLPVGGESYSDCIPHIEKIAKSFEHHGYDGQHDRWWGWNEATRTELHHWWAAAVEPPTK